MSQNCRDLRAFLGVKFSSRVFLCVKELTFRNSVHLHILLMIPLTSGVPNSGWTDWKELCGQDSLYLFSEDLQNWYIPCLTKDSFSSLFIKHRSDAADNCELYGGFLAQVYFKLLSKNSGRTFPFQIDSMEENFCLLEYINSLVFFLPFILKKTIYFSKYKQQQMFFVLL